MAKSFNDKVKEEEYLSNIYDQIHKTKDVDSETTKPRLSKPESKLPVYKRVPARSLQPEPTSSKTSQPKPDIVAKPTELKSGLLPFLRTTPTGVSHPQVSSFVPSAFQMYHIIHYMDDIMRKNSYFLKQQDAWHPFVSRIYFGILFCLKTVKGEISTGIATRERKKFYLSFMKDYPADTLPVPGPLVALFKALSPAKPADSLYAQVTPTIPTIVGPAAASTLTAEVHQLILPNIPALIGFTNSILTAAPDAIPDYSVPGTFNDAVDRLLNGSAFVAHHWTQDQRSFLLTPGLLYKAETNRDIDTKFRLYGSRLNIPTIQGVTNLTSLSSYLCLNEPNQWFGNIISIMQCYSDYFRGSETLAQCDEPQCVAPLVDTQYIKLSSNDVATNVFTTLTDAFPDQTVFSFEAKHLTTERNWKNGACAAAQNAKVNVSFSNDEIPAWDDIGDLNQTRFGDYWSQSPIMCRTPPERAWKTIGTIITQHFAVAKPITK